MHAQVGQHVTDGLIFQGFVYIIFTFILQPKSYVRAGGAGGVADGDDSSDWEEASEEGEGDGPPGDEALSVPGLLGPDLLDITAAAAAADDDLGRSLKVRGLALDAVSPLSLCPGIPHA